METTKRENEIIRALASAEELTPSQIMRITNFMPHVIELTRLEFVCGAIESRKIGAWSSERRYRLKERAKQIGDHH